MSSFPPLIDPASLAGHLEDPSLRLFDATVHLNRQVEGGPYSVATGRLGYLEAHLPGAAFADIPGDLSDPGSPYPFTLSSPAYFAAAAGRLGIGAGTHVVTYSQTTPMWATRLWWLLRYFGFDQVSVLDGGRAAWEAASLPLEAGERHYEPSTFEARPRPELLATLDEVAANVGRGAPGCLINALPGPAYLGDGPGAYSRPGRIPGSLSVPSATLLDTGTGRFTPPEQIHAAYEAAGVHLEQEAAGVTVYCGGGISATVDLFALFLLGRAHDRLYDGSLTEWSADPELPLVTG